MEVAEEIIMYLLGFMGALMAVTALLVVRGKDLVYASAMLAILGTLNAALIALLGFTVIAAFVVIVYVGAAVMFIIMSISMLGGGGTESREDFRGVLAASMIGAGLLMALIVSGVIKVYTSPGPLDLSRVSELLASKYVPVLGVLFVALAATLVEAISIARRGE